MARSSDLFANWILNVLSRRLTTDVFARTVTGVAQTGQLCSGCYSVLKVTYAPVRILWSLLTQHQREVPTAHPSVLFHLLARTGTRVYGAAEGRRPQPDGRAGESLEKHKARVEKERPDWLQMAGHKRQAGRAGKHRTGAPTQRPALLIISAAFRGFHQYFSS